METKPKNDLTIANLLDEDQPPAECSTIAAQNTAVPFPFLPLYSQYSFAQRLKSTIPFSKLFFSNNIKPLNQTKAAAEHPEITHDKDQCMFLLKLDAQGRTGILRWSPGGLHFFFFNVGCLYSGHLLLTDSSEKCD